MKNKILYLIIGFLVGAIVTTSAFLIYHKTLETNSKGQEMRQMNENGNMGEPPQMPNGGTPSKMPSNLNNNNNV